VVEERAFFTPSAMLFNFEARSPKRTSDKVTQANISITQDSSRTTKHLEEQAKRLNDLVLNLSELLGQKKA
jgi:acetolactate synthase regulatory subunit